MGGEMTWWIRELQTAVFRFFRLLMWSALYMPFTRGKAEQTTLVRNRCPMSRVEPS